MNFSKLGLPDFVTLFLTFPIVWVGVPYAYLFSTPNSNTPIWLAVASAFSLFVLFLVYLVLLKAAEQHEIERLQRYWKIFLGLKPTAFVFVVGIFGYALIGVVTPVQEATLKVSVMMFGTLLIILSMRWWMEDIKGFRLPKSDTL